MNYNEYEIGEPIRLSISITISGSKVDPNHLALFVIPPTGILEQFIYGVTGTFIKDGAGDYHLDYYNSRSGQYMYKFYASGTAWGAEVQRFVVKRE